MELRNLSHFVAVADTLNFRLAAERLHLTQPTLTRSIASFERQLGLQLFERDKHHVALTIAGADLLDQARRVLAQSDQFAQMANRLSSAKSHVFRLGIYANGLAELTGAVLERFLDQNPLTQLEVRDMPFDHGILPILSGDFHAVVVRAPTAVPGLTITPVFSEPVDALVSAGHRFASRESISVRELFHDPWVTLPALPGSWSARWLAMDERDPARVPVVAALANSAADFIAAVAYQGCIGLVPRSELRMNPHPAVRSIPVEDLGPFTASVAYPTVGPHPLAPAFAEVAREVAAQMIDSVPGAFVPSEPTER